MRITLNPFRQKRSRRWWTVSIIAHVMIALLLAQIMFRFPIGQLMGIPRYEIQQERLQYIALPRGTESSTGNTKTPSQPASPAPLQRPSTVPNKITAPPLLDSVRSRTAGGAGAGYGDTGSGYATGLVPRMPDSRIPLVAGQVARVPRTTSEDVDSVIALAVGIVNDSIAIAAGQRKPGDWTMKGKDGSVWGWDQQGNIRLGKFVIPGALLALLPLNTSGPVGPIEARSMAYIRRDIMENAQRTITEDEFRTAVKRIRERKEREKREKLVAAGKDSTAQH